MNRFVSFTCLSLLAAGPLACGSLASDKDPVLATVHGELTNPQSLDTPTDTRVAVVWLGFGSGYSVAEDLQVQPVFPSQFKLELTHVPPAAAMVNKAKMKKNSTDATPPGPPPDGDQPTPSPAPPSSGVHRTDLGPNDWADDFAFALGAVVAYQDLNHNGRLDLVDDGATAYVDRILGANPQTVLVYLEGTLPPELADENGQMPQHGYNLFHMANCEVQLTDTAGNATNGGAEPPTGSASTCNDKTTWLSIDTLYTLPLTGDPKFNEIMCKSGGSFVPGASSGGGSATTDNSNSSGPSSGGSGAGGTFDSDGGTSGSGTGGSLPGSTGSGDASAPPPEQYPSANDPLLQCAPDGRSFTYDCKPTQPKLCGDTIEVSCGAMPLPPGPVPSNWPCPVH